MTFYWTTLPTSQFTSPAPHPSGFCSIQAMTMAATLPVDSKVAVTVARLGGKREGAHPIKEAKGGHKDNNDNVGLPLYK
jgi:hypothetical protein